MSDPAITNLQPGSVFAGDYRIVRPLSQGGMGAVFVAEQQSTGKPRALKLMLPQLVADPVLRQRFEQEARIGSHIDSEHVVEVVGAGVDAATGMPWLAMELLRGEDLAHCIARRGALPASDVLALFEQLCHALGAAHTVGIVHRDLKPENLFLAEARRAGAAFTVKVLDFGIAKITQEATSKATQAMGSPIWMAPEQSSRSPVTPATDVWALGLIAFYLLTGRYFWRAAQRDEATVMELMREVLFEPIVAASARARELGIALPPSFDAWFARCVTRDAAARFANATIAFVELRALWTGATGRPLASVPTMPDRVATVYVPPAGTAPNAAYVPGVAAQGGTGLAGAYTLAEPPNPTQAPGVSQNSRLVPLVILVGVAMVCATITGVAWLLTRDAGSGALASGNATPLPAPVSPAAPAASTDPTDPEDHVTASPGDVVQPRGPSGPASAAAHGHGSPVVLPAAPSGPNVHVGTWSCFETYELVFTSPFGQQPVRKTRNTTAYVVDNGDHTLTTAYVADGDTCRWRSTAKGATATAIPGQTCHTSGGGTIVLTSATTVVTDTTSTIRSTSKFEQSVQQGFQRVDVAGSGASSISCHKQ